MKVLGRQLQVTLLLAICYYTKISLDYASLMGTEVRTIDLGDVEPSLRGFSDAIRGINNVACDNR